MSQVVHRRRQVARIIRRGLLLVALGLITSICLAVALAATAAIPTYPRTHAAVFEQWDRAWSTAEHRRFGIVDRMWHDLSHTEPVRTPRAFLAAVLTKPDVAQLVAKHRQQLAETVATRSDVKVLDSVPWWGTFARGSGHEPPTAYVTGSDTGFGWPLPCMWYQVLTTFSQVTMSTTSDRLEGGCLLGGTISSIDKSSLRVLPLRPIWLGLAVNTLVFAAAWGVPIVGIPALRRARRRRRGWCVACGYDLWGLAAAECPECGRLRPRP